MVDHAKLVKRAPQLPLVRLGDREDRIEFRAGAKFPAYPAKERDLLDAPTGRRRTE